MCAHFLLDICFYFTLSPAASLKHIIFFKSWVIFKSVSELKIPSETPRPSPPPTALWLCHSFVFQDKSQLLFWAAGTVKCFIVIVSCCLCFFLKVVVCCCFFSPCPLRIQSSYAALQRINQDLEDKMHRTVRDFQPRFNFILVDVFYVALQHLQPPETSIQAL